MKSLLPEHLIRLAGLCPPLYVVGGSVRDYLLGYPPGPGADWDLSSPADEETFVSAAQRCGFTVKSVYRATGAVKLVDADGAGYEFTRFRSDKYVRGLHAPSEIVFTDDIQKDALRRDFRANAVYYDVGRGEYVDPLGGRKDIETRVLATVAPASKVFGEDGLRLLRLARFCAQLDFTPDEDCLRGASEHAALIRDIVPERVFTELDLLLHADLKHGFRDGPYRGLGILHQTGVLKELLPELTLGEGMRQRADFHDHDVLEHSLRCVRYARSDIRFAALLHDVGKPLCFLRDGNFHAHPEEGARIAEEILTRLKAPKRLTGETCRLIALHMRDYNLSMKESKLRREFTVEAPLLDRLLALKQADFSACKDVLSEAPCVTKWNDILARMKEEGAPLTLSGLAVNGKDAASAGIPPKKTGDALYSLLLWCAENGRRNQREILLKRLKKMGGSVGSPDEI